MAVIRLVFFLMPLLFGVGFLAPLIAQSLDALAWAAPWGMSSLHFGLALGAGLGLIATLRGRWI